MAEVMGRELPKDSSGRAVLPEVQAEIQHIQAILDIRRDALRYKMKKFGAGARRTAGLADPLAKTSTGTCENVRSVPGSPPMQ